MRSQFFITTNVLKKKMKRGWFFHTAFEYATVYWEERGKRLWLEYNESAIGEIDGLDVLIDNGEKKYVESLSREDPQ